MKAMPVTLVEPPKTAESLRPQRKKWTREECQALERAGVVDLERYELIEGELLRKMSKNLPHICAITLLIGWLQRVFGVEFAVPEPTIDVAPEDNPSSYPEPDAIVLVRSVRELTGHIRAGDIRLVVEVSDSSLTFDLHEKSWLYARAGIPEYWVLDINARRLFAHREPENGKYKTVTIYSANESVASLADPSSSVRVGDLLG